MSLKKTAPTICSGLSSQTGRRECWLSTMVLRTSSSEAVAETETISRRGFMISRTDKIVEIEHAVDHVFLQFREGCRQSGWS